MSTSGTAPKPRFEAIDRAQCSWDVIDIEALIPPGHRARLLWEFLGKMDLRQFTLDAKAVENRPGRNMLSPQLLIAMWLYGYSIGISSAREMERESSYEPGLKWLTALNPVNHHTLSDFRVKHGAALQDFFVQVLGILTMKKLITLERVTVDGTKVRACVNKKTFNRAAKIREHLAAARKHLESLQQEEADQERCGRKAAAQKRAARERVARLQAAMEEMEKLQAEKADEKPHEKIQVSTSDADARFMRNSDNGLAPSYNVQLATDGANKLFVAVSVSKQANDSGQLIPAIDKVKEQSGQYPPEVIADGDYTTRAAVIGMSERGVDFYGSWKTASEKSNYGISAQYRASAFTYEESSNQMICPEGKRLNWKSQQHYDGQAVLNVFAANKEDCLSCLHRQECSPKSSMARYGRTVSLLEEDGRVAAYHQKMSTEEAKAKYRTRAPIAEFPHAWLKTKFQFVRYRCRGLAKVTAETLWACLAYNVQQYFRLTGSVTTAA